MAEEVKMTKDNMDIWFEKQGYVKTFENESITEYRKFHAPNSDSKYAKDVILSICNESKSPKYFKYSVEKFGIAYPGFTRAGMAITSDELSHLQTKANILMKKFMQDAIKAEYPHVASHSPIGGNQ